MDPLPNTICPACGAPNECVPAACGSFAAPCWCAGITIDASVLDALPEAARGKACLCRSCATARPPSPAVPPATDEGAPR